MNKKCTKCNSIKDINSFYKCKSKKDGFQSNCKECHNAATNRWRSNNPEKYQNYERTRHYTKAQKKRNQNYAKKRRVNMNDSYIRELIGKKDNIRSKDITQELIKAWRINLQLKRLLRKKS
tara:strand:+ start:2661 stop:3023 length:363 start_codon:yes stop_codon:yes gene_type:complete